MAPLSLGRVLALYAGAMLWSGAGTGFFSAYGALADSRFTLKNWRTEDGLPQMTAKVIRQTHDGYLWVGTLNGLARFDGSRFQTYSAANTPELFSDSINVLYEDRRGQLWIGTIDGGVARYREGRFKLYSNADGLGSITVNAVTEDGDGVLWWGRRVGCTA